MHQTEALSVMFDASDMGQWLGFLSQKSRQSIAAQRREISRPKSLQGDAIWPGRLHSDVSANPASLSASRASAACAHAVIAASMLSAKSTYSKPWDVCILSVAAAKFELPSCSVAANEMRALNTR